jgi:hypothetical protein
MATTIGAHSEAQTRHLAAIPAWRRGQLREAALASTAHVAQQQAPTGPLVRVSIGPVPAAPMALARSVDPAQPKVRAPVVTMIGVRRLAMVIDPCVTMASRFRVPDATMANVQCLARAIVPQPDGHLPVATAEATDATIVRKRGSTVPIVRSEAMAIVRPPGRLAVMVMGRRRALAGTMIALLRVATVLTGRCAPIVIVARPDPLDRSAIRPLGRAVTTPATTPLTTAARVVHAEMALRRGLVVMTVTDLARGRFRLRVR